MANPTVKLGKIQLSPTPGSAKTLSEYQQNVASWTRSAEKAIRQLESLVHQLSGDKIPVPPTPTWPPT